MKLKTYQAWSMPEAIAFVKRDLGDDAVILHTRTFERGGFLGFRKRTVVEITAGRAAEMPAEAKAPAAPLEPVAAPRPSSARAAAVGAYATAARRNGASEAPGASAVEGLRAGGVPTPEPVLDMEVERERTRRLAQAMAIKFERIERESRPAQEARQQGAPASGAGGRGEVAERTAAAANERAVEAATRISDRRESRAADPKPQGAMASAAQRFVLVPEPRVGAPAKAPAETMATRVAWPTDAGN
ncbi:MAG: flagellar biosynthesis protein FlhF, partial [Planctomycetota bacterium]